MRLFWQKQSKPEVPASPMVSISADDVASIARAAAQAAIDEARTEGAARFAEEIKRTMQYDAAIPGTPPSNPQSPLTPTAGAPYPIYKLDQPIDWATPIPPQRRPRSVVSINTLRTIADTYDVLRSCIQHLKRETIAVPFQVVPSDEKDDSKKTLTQIREMEEWFSPEGGNGGIDTPRSHFECEVIEDLSIVGMAAVWHNRTIGNQLLGSEAIDAATIRPVTDYFGWGAQDYKYEQWIYGVLCGRYTADDLTFTGLATNCRSWSPYYASPVEWLVASINTAIRSDDWNRRFFTDGNTSQQVYGVPDTWSPADAKAFTEYWDALSAGDSAQRQKTKFVPGGVRSINSVTRKDQDFSELDLWLLRRCCAIMGVQPASIGFAGEQYKVSQQDSMESTSTFGVGVILEFFTSFYNSMCKRRGCTRVKVQYVSAREEKALERATRNSTLVNAGIKTRNEARLDEGLDPHDSEGADLLYIQNTMVPIDKEDCSCSCQDPEAAADGKQPDKPAIDPDKTDEYDPEAERTALAKWERKALNALSRGAAPSVPFESDDIPKLKRITLRVKLRGCASADEVRHVFRSLELPTVYLIRHTATKLNEQGRVRSWKNPKLSGPGRKQAERVGCYMVGKSLIALKAGNLKRTKQVAKIVSGITGAPIVDISRAWTPWDVGDLAGRLVDDVRPIVEDYARNRPDDPVEHGESLNQYLERFIPHLQHVLDHASHPGAVGIVTHGRNIKTTIAWIKAGMTGTQVDIDEFLTYDVPMGAVLILTQDNGTWSYDVIDVDNEDVPDLNDLENGGLS